MHGGINAAFVAADHNELIAAHSVPGFYATVVDAVPCAGDRRDPGVLKFSRGPDEHLGAHSTAGCFQLEAAA